jgi:hypothetical protein
MPDVVEHGPAEERPPGLRPGVSRVVLVVGLVLAVVALSRSGLLSADPPAPSVPSSASVAPEVLEASALVARVGDRVVRLRYDEDEGARLPGDDPSSLVPVRLQQGTGRLVGVQDGQLFSVGTARDAQWAPIGRATEVLSATATSGRAVVWRGAEVVEVDVSTGRLVAADPFSGFDASAGWVPEGLVAVTGSRALLMTRPVPAGDRVELALAWSSLRVQVGLNPPVQSLGIYDRLLGIADDWVLAGKGACPGPDCRVQVVTLTRDDVLVREVVAPEGWTFRTGRLPGRSHEALLPVERLGEPGSVALARVVPGGDNALLIGGTERVALRAGLVESLAGWVYLVTRNGGGEEQLRVWSPESPGRAELLEDLDEGDVIEGGTSFPPLARLVCVCG